MTARSAPTLMGSGAASGQRGEGEGDEGEDRGGRRVMARSLTCASGTNLPSFTVSISKESMPEAVVVGGREAEDAALPHEALGVLQRGPDLGPVEPHLLHRGGEQLEGVPGVAAEAAHLLAVPLLVGVAVGDQHRLLGIAGRERVGDGQPPEREDHALGGGAGRLGVGQVPEAVALVDGEGEPELADVLHQDRLGRLDGPVEHRLGVRRPSAWWPRRRGRWRPCRRPRRGRSGSRTPGPASRSAPCRPCRSRCWRRRRRCG